METITWHKNMCDYFKDLTVRNTDMGYRIDPTCVNSALMNNEAELSSLRFKYVTMLTIRCKQKQIIED